MKLGTTGEWLLAVIISCIIGGALIYLSYYPW